MEQILEKALERALVSQGPIAQQFKACEETASAIMEYATTDVNGKKLTNPEEITGKLNLFLPVIDALFDRVPHVPQGILALASALVRLGLQTGHLVTENPIEHWYADIPGGFPTPIYFFWEAPEYLTYQIPDRLKEKRNEKLQSLNQDKQATAGSRRR